MRKNTCKLFMCVYVIIIDTCNFPIDFPHAAKIKREKKTPLFFCTVQRTAQSTYREAIYTALYTLYTRNNLS